MKRSEILQEAAKGLQDVKRQGFYLVYDHSGRDVEVALLYPHDWGSSKGFVAMGYLKALPSKNVGGASGQKDTWVVYEVGAKKGWGPLLYDVLMESVYPDWIEPHPGHTKAAEKVWKFYRNRRRDVEVVDGRLRKKPTRLKRFAMTLNKFGSSKAVRNWVGEPKNYRSIGMDFGVDYPAIPGAWESVVQAVDRLLAEGVSTMWNGTQMTPGLYFHRSNDTHWRSSLQVEFQHLRPKDNVRVAGERIFIQEVHRFHALGYDPDTREQRELRYFPKEDIVALSDSTGVIATSEVMAP